MTEPQPVAHRIDDIEWLRAVAVLGIVLHHSQDNLFSWKPVWLTNVLDHFDLWSGVDIFFVISGFVIARNLLSNLEDSRGNIYLSIRYVLAFWVARAFRLLPSAWLWLGLILLASIAFNETGVFGSFDTNVMATLAGVFQYANFREINAFGQHEYGASFVYWSLSLEEQFYLSLPLIILCFRRYLAPLLVAVILIQAFTPRGLLLIFLRTDALAWGVLLAMLYKQRKPSPQIDARKSREHYPQQLLGISLIAAIGGISALQTLPFGQRVSLVAMLAAALVWIATYNRDYLSGRPGALRHFMLWCGSRSYAIYLIHIPAFLLTRELWLRFSETPLTGGAEQTLVLISVSLLLIGMFAELNYRYLEMPLRRIGKKVSWRCLQSATNLLIPHATHGHAERIP